ncbi:MAG: GntR family transcriptional regulator [Rhizorhabdus sp.]
MLDTSGSTALKRGARIAGLIERDIAEQTLPPGHYLGTEDDLSSQHGVSRWVVREAIAIAEMDGLVESRCGNAGGLYVSAPGPDLRVATLRNFMTLAGATAEDINDLRAVLEEHALLRAMRRLTMADVDKLRTFQDLPEGAAPEQRALNTHAILDHLLALPGNAATSLFCIALAQVNIDRALWYGATTDAIQDLSERTWELRLQQVEALIAFDTETVLACQRQIADAGIALHRGFDNPPADVTEAVERASLLSRNYLFARGVRLAKKPEAVARFIAQKIIGMEEGSALGSEATLLARLGVSRNVLRESIRLLEQYGIVRVQVGKEGGLRVIKGPPLNVIRATSLFLAQDYARDPSSFHSVTRDLQLYAADLACRRAASGDPALVAAIDMFDAQAEARPASIRDFVFAHYHFLAEASGSRALQCAMEALVFQVDFRRGFDRDAEVEALSRMQTRLAAAIRSGDVALSRRITLVLRQCGWAFGPIPRPAAKILER